MLTNRLRRGILLLWGMFVLSACAPPAAAPVIPLPTLTSAATTDTRPDPTPFARAYLNAWQEGDYSTMYTWLSVLSQDGISENAFTAIYQDTSTALGLQRVDYEILSVLTKSDVAQVGYRVGLETSLLGTITRETAMELTFDGELWRPKWEHSLILPELRGGNTLWMEYRAPARGNIYDMQGEALAAQTDAVSMGLIAGQTDDAQEPLLFAELETLLGLDSDDIQARLATQRDGWYMPLGEVSAKKVEERFAILTDMRGLVMEPYRSRYYFEGGVASHVLGYIGVITEDEVEEYRALGYQQDESVGRMGLEAWGEAYLAGGRGGVLYVVNPQGEIVTKLAEAEPALPQSIYTTLDKTLQQQVQDAMAGFIGAAVVMERDTGRILALVSSPTFDPNIFDPTNYNSSYLLSDLLTDPRTPLLNRATQGQYPLGSVFKIITMAAALESGQYNAESSYYCGHAFREVPGTVRYDWTYWRGAPASGPLTLPEALMRSCNPWFWHIGLDFFNQEMTTQVSDMATAFGLGRPSGLEEVVEESGQIPVPELPIDAVNFAIGQGATQVTPIQVARFVAAVGNGGDLLRPQIIERIVAPDGNNVHVFEPEVTARLPLSPTNLAVVQDAMRLVVNNSRGSAYWRFINFPVPVAGKTGTAEAPPSEPHAWFAGYTEAEPGTKYAEKPDLAIAIIAEHAGEGSAVAAPLFRRVLEYYYFGEALTPMPWESESAFAPPP